MNLWILGLNLLTWWKIYTMKYLFVFLLLVMVGCGDATLNSTVGETKTIDIIQDINDVNQVDTTINIGEITALEPKICPSIKIGELAIMTEDLGLMNWEDAKKACADLGDGWRLPTKDELNILYENKAKIGGFCGGYYCEFFGVRNRLCVDSGFQHWTPRPPL